MRLSNIVIFGWALVAALLLAPVSQAAEADEKALAERIAALADRFGNTAAAGPYKQALYDAAGRLSEREVRFRRNRFRAAELAGDSEAMLATLQEWRKLEPGSIFVQMRLIDAYVTRLQTADARLDYLKKVLESNTVDAQVRSHAAVHMARLQLEQSRLRQAMETLRRAVLLNGLNLDALNMQWQLSVNGSTPIQRMTLLLAMLKAEPGSVEAVVRVAEELAFLEMTQASLQWYGHATTMAQLLGGLGAAHAKDHAAQLLIAGQDRGAAEIGSRLLARDSSDPGAWFLTLLAERGMKDRIELVRKNALIGLLNRVAMARGEIGAREATTRPLGSDDVSLPDLSGDEELLKKTTPDKRRDYVAAISDVAWFFVYHDDKPADAAPFIAKLKAVAPEDEDTYARLQGWALFKSGKLEEARQMLASAAERDPLAALAILRILRQDPATAAEATDLGRNLVKGYPARLLGAYVRAELGEAVPTPTTDPTVDAVRDMLDRFPREVLAMAATPQEFVTMRLQPQQVGHDYAEPILIDVEVRNLKELPVVIGSPGMVRDVWLDVQLRGLLQQWVLGASFEKADGPVILQPGAAMRWTVRLDRGPLSNVLERSVQQSMQLTISGLTNAVPTDKGVVPGTCGIRGKMAQMLERKAASLTSDAAVRNARTVIEGNDPSAKLQLVDQIVAHLHLMADPEGPPTVKAMDAEMRDLLIRLAQDSAVTVRSWARFQMARMLVEPAEKTAADLSTEPVWFARLLAAMASMETSESGRQAVLTKLSSDEDASVRRLAQSIPTVMVKPQEPVTQPK